MKGFLENAMLTTCFGERLKQRRQTRLKEKKKETMEETRKKHERNSKKRAIS